VASPPADSIKTSLSRVVRTLRTHGGVALAADLDSVEEFLANGETEFALDRLAWTLERLRPPIERADLLFLLGLARTLHIEEHSVVYLSELLSAHGEG
jgi:hypothetical protein